MVYDDVDDDSEVLSTDGVESDGAWSCIWCLVVHMGHDDADGESIALSTDGVESHTAW